MTDIARALDVREIPIEVGGTVEVLLSSSDLRIRGTDADQVVLRTRNGRPIDDEVTIETEPGRVRIRDGEGSFRLGPVHLRLRGVSGLDIDVPRSIAIVCRTLSGDVVAEGIGGASRWNSASGDITVAVDAGPVAIDTMSGDATVRASVPLGLTVRTVSGDVRVRAPRLEGSAITTTSGDVHLVAALAAGARHTVSNVSGDVDIETDSSVRVETHSITGDVKVEGPHRTEGGRGSRTVIVGDGAAVLAVSTTSGDVRVWSLVAEAGAPAPKAVIAEAGAPAPKAVIAEAGAPAPKAVAAVAPVIPPVAPAPPVVVAEAEAVPNLVRATAPAHDGETPVSDRREAARLEVLRALERGEMDVETASHRLEILEDAGPRAFRGVVLMAADPLDEVLRLVAEGRLTAEEAAPILAALEDAPVRKGAPAAQGGPRTASGEAPDPASRAAEGSGGSLRLEIREAGRQVVQLRLPVSIGRYALDRVPGLSADQVDSVKDALRSGMKGPILEVDDGSNSVRIVVD